MGLWNWNAKNFPRDPDSDRLMAHWRNYAIVRPNMAIREWAVAWCFSGEGDPVYHVPVKSGRSHALDNELRIPVGTKPDPSGDSHLYVRDTITKREHDIFEAVYDEATGRIVQAGGGASFPVGSPNELVQCWGGSAAQTPLKRGLVLPQWIADGKIPQTLQCAHPCIGGTPRKGRFPAINNAPTAGSGRCPAHTDPSNHLSEGSWLALPADYPDRPDLPQWQRVICNGLRDKGMILRDNGGALTVYGANDINMPLPECRWESVGLSGKSVSFSSSFPWHELELLSPPPAS